MLIYGEKPLGAANSGVLDRLLQRGHMADFPALPLFTDAFMADTAHLTDAERGRYLLLLMIVWRSPGCRVPNDDVWLAKRFVRPVDQFQREVKPLIAEFCKTDGNWITQKRLTEEWDWCKNQRKRATVNAKIRWNKEKQLCDSNAGLALLPSNALNSTQLNKKEEDTARTVSPPRYAFESGVIRLSQKDFDKWKLAFSHLDVPAELIGLTEWAGQQGQKWFFAVSGFLTKKNREMGLREQQKQTPNSRALWEAAQNKKIEEIMRQKGSSVVFADEVPGGIPGIE
jgi:uncharacterized protein YdaU (DUF1376 family)